MDDASKTDSDASKTDASKTEAYIANQKLLLKTIEDITNDYSKLSRNELENKYETFSRECPKTWLHIMDKHININNLNQLKGQHETYIRLYERFGGTHAQRKKRTEFKLGQDLAEEYIYPTFGRPTQSQLDQATALIDKRDSEHPRIKQKHEVIPL
jgi:hypothetical protein